VEIDLLTYETEDGRSIRKTIDFLIPFVVNNERWTWQQIVDFDRTSFVSLFKRAAIGLKDPSYLDPIDFLPSSAASDRVHLCFG
jgi:hypothetical protein